MRFENPAAQLKPTPENLPHDNPLTENDLARADELLSADRSISPSEAKFLREIGGRDPEGRLMKTYRNRKSLEAMENDPENGRSLAEASSAQEETDKRRAQEILETIRKKTAPEASAEDVPGAIPLLEGYSPEKRAAVSMLYETLISVAEKMGEQRLLEDIRKIIQEKPETIYDLDNKLNKTNTPFSPDGFNPDDPDAREEFHKFLAKAANDGNFDSAIQIIAA